MHVDSINESRDAIFFENIFPMKDMHSTSRFSSEITPESVAPIVIETSEQPVKHEEILEKDASEAPRRSKRQRVAKSFGDDFTVYLVDDTPTTIAEAYASLDADDWKEAVQSEMDSILSKVRCISRCHFCLHLSMARVALHYYLCNLFIDGGRRNLCTQKYDSNINKTKFRAI